MDAINNNDSKLPAARQVARKPPPPPLNLSSQQPVLSHSTSCQDSNKLPSPSRYDNGVTGFLTPVETSQRFRNGAASSLSKRDGPSLKLNLSNMTDLSCGNITKTSVPLTSPAQYSISSAEESNFIFENDPKEISSLGLKNSPYKRNIIIHQQSTPNIMSARLLEGKGNFKTTNSTNKDDQLIAKSLSTRRNIKKLVLEPVDTSTSDVSGIDSPHRLDIKDPEKKIGTAELIKSIRNLELGLEYQMSIHPDELVALKKLGSGQSGTVSKVLHLPTQKTMARKIVHLEAKEVVQSQIMRELRIMHECDSPFIIEFYGTFLQEGNVVICMEYADCGSLAQVFKITGPFPEFMLKHVAHSVLSGLIYLYDDHRIIHRDVKPSNVLMTSKGKIKLCDFGVSRELINSMADTFVGTSTYMSPERIQGGVYSVKGDVWSLGIMLYELASGKLAFTNNDAENENGNVSILELLQRIVNEEPPNLSVKDGFSSELSDFVSLCLKKEAQRLAPADLMKHPFLSDFLESDSLRVNSQYRGDIKKWAKNVRRVQKGKPLSR